MNIPKELVKRVEDKMLEVFLLAQQKFNQTFDLPNLTFDIHSKRVAGLACHGIKTIKINPKFLLEFPEQIIGRTIGHEVGHFVTRKVYPNAKQAHGPEFKHVMRTLNLPDTRCHSMRLAGVDYNRTRQKPPRPYLYACTCQQHHLTRTLHIRILKGRTYTCKKCKTRIRFISQTGVVIQVK